VVVLVRQALGGTVTDEALTASLADLPVWLSAFAGEP
jgi:hypothetical protein